MPIPESDPQLSAIKDLVNLFSSDGLAMWRAIVRIWQRLVFHIDPDEVAK